MKPSNTSYRYTESRYLYRIHGYNITKEENKHDVSKITAVITFGSLFMTADGPKVMSRVYVSDD